MKNIEKALELINTFATGDTGKAVSLLAEGYIQHNLAYATGREAFVDSVAYLAAAPVKTTVNNIRAFEDGDKVFLQTVYNFAGMGEQVAFDIFRFDADGMIAEHWDNLAAKADPNPSGHTQIDGTMEKKDVDREGTRKIVAAFVGDVLRGENPGKLTDYFDGDAYIQHNTGIADGLSGLGAALAALARTGHSDDLHQDPLCAGGWQLWSGCQRRHFRRRSYHLLRPVPCGEWQDCRTLGRDGDPGCSGHLGK